MRILSRMLVLSLGLLACGCVARSLHPAYTDEDLTAEPRLVGRWEGLPTRSGGPSLGSSDWQAEGPWVVERGLGSELRIYVYRGEAISTYRGRVFRIGRDSFLDLVPDPSETWSSTYGVHVAVLHTFSRLRFSADTLMVETLGSGWLKRAVEEGTLDASAAVVLDAEGDPILTGDTAAMREVLARAAASPEAFAVGRFLRIR